MRRSLALLFAAVAVGSAAAAVSQNRSVSPSPPPAPLLGPGPKQPIFFSHKLHAGKLGMECLYCHYGAERSPIANLPPVSLCMGCHKLAVTDRPEVQKLAGYWQRGEAPPWVEVYRLPDHVKFNHKRHVRAGFACQQCHGKVEEMDVLRQAPSMKMGWCVSCHRQNLNHPKFPATMDCVSCHH